MRRSRRNGKEETSFWQSYSDIMASILMVTVLVLTGTILNAQKSLIEKETLVKQEQEELKDAKAQIVEARAQIIEARAQIEKSKEEIEAQKIELDSIRDDYQKQKEMMEAQRIELDSIRDDYQKQKEMMEKIIGVKKDIIQELIENFKGETQLKINPQTGAITFDSKLLFDFDKSVLKPEGKAFLDRFMPIYMSVLNDERFSDKISEIIVEGHADTQGTYLYNLKLSQERALSVASYFLSDTTKLFSEQELLHLREIVTANGRSFSVPILNPDGSVNPDLSRRVEIQFRLTDEEMINDLISILGGY